MCSFIELDISHREKQFNGDEGADENTRIIPFFFYIGAYT
jgi:hypothetical protein